VKALPAVLVLLLGMPEVWAWMTPFDVWLADQIATGLLVMLLAALAFRRSPAAAALAMVFGAGRSVCTAVWPDASDAQGSICDSQTGLPLTLAVLILTLFAVDRMRR
jgi:hypothetical protein